MLECLEKDPASRPAGALELDRRLGACAATGAWTPEKAAAWWSSRYPDKLPEPVLTRDTWHFEGQEAGSPT